MNLLCERFEERETVIVISDDDLSRYEEEMMKFIESTDVTLLISDEGNEIGVGSEQFSVVVFL